MVSNLGSVNLVAFESREGDHWNFGFLNIFFLLRLKKQYSTLEWSCSVYPSRIQALLSTDKQCSHGLWNLNTP
jgi:hypothetical protein